MPSLTDRLPGARTNLRADSDSRSRRETIVKIKKRTHPFAMIDARALNDPRISWKAKGLEVVVSNFLDKGRVDKDVPLKVGAAVAWCKAASKQKSWNFLYVPDGVFQSFSGDAISELASVCAPHLADLLSERVEPQFTLPLGEIGGEDTGLAEFISE